MKSQMCGAYDLIERELDRQAKSQRLRQIVQISQPTLALDEDFQSDDASQVFHDGYLKRPSNRRE